MMDRPYCSLDDVKRELRWKLDDVSKDLDLEAAIESASRYVEAHLRRDFLPHEYAAETPLVLRADKALGNKLYLPYAPVLTLGTVTLGETVLTLDKDFYFDPALGTLTRIAGDWNLKDQHDSYVKVTGEFGYASDGQGVPPAGLPAHIRRATAMIAAALSGYLRREQISPDGTRVDVATREIPKTVYALLEAGTPPA